uniref:Uncharacterized protein n=1 Tax=viral metagenome TaxID=1070528 RepID=A0A6C0F8V6_9ZZZZ
MEEYLVLFEECVRKELRNAIRDIKPRCQAKCEGKYCNKVALYNNKKTCKKHLNYKFNECKIVKYHNHLPGEIGVNCELCNLCTDDCFNSAECII